MGRISAIFRKVREKWVDAFQGLLEAIVVACIWIVADRFAGRGWSVTGYLELAFGWGAMLVMVRALPFSKLIKALLEVVGGFAFLGLVAIRHAPPDLQPGGMAYGFGLCCLALGGWRAWCSRQAPYGSVAEPLRVLLVTAAALFVISPLVTTRFLGGADARWYAYVLHDFIEQWRVDGPPVFLGLGEFVWNGAVHPFRSAPIYLYLAGLWDWLTFNHLSTIALQHLVATTAAIAAGWGCYAAGVKLAPQHRWAAAAVAAVYVMSPAALMAIYVADAYMTYLAAAAIVWVFFQNARVLLQGSGWLGLAGSISLTWMCHPPTAMQVTLISAGLQLGRLAFGGCCWKEWRPVFLAAPWFAALTLFYLVGMSELPKTPATDLSGAVVQVALLFVGWFALARALMVPGGWRWSWILVPVTAGLARYCPVWLGWLAQSAAILIVVRLAAGRRDLGAYAPLLMAGAILAGAWGMDVVINAGLIRMEDYLLGLESWTTIAKARYFEPLSAGVTTAGDVQPGWALWTAGLLAGIAAWRRQALVSQLMVGGVLLLLPLLLHWPGPGRFMIRFVPDALQTMSGLAMDLRMMPIVAAMLAVSGLVALRTLAADHLVGKWRWFLAAGLMLAGLWTGWQARLFVARGEKITAHPKIQARDWRSENAPIDRFVYDLLSIPDYFSHGKMDPRLEVRVLDDAGRIVYGPKQVADATEAAESRTLDLITEPIPGHPDWLQINPAWRLQPGERVLLRFAFDPTRRYNGYLLFLSENGYREYILPESGKSLAFGTGPDQAKIISLWNSGADPENYQLQFLMNPGHEVTAGMRFATVSISPFDHSHSLLEVTSINPLRITTRLDHAGWLETPRSFLPGYRVWLNGVRVQDELVRPSRQKLLQVAIPAGIHQVEVRYVGTAALWCAWAISLGAWCLLIGTVLIGRPERWIRRVYF